MFQLPKSVLSFGAGAVALGILVLTAPRAAHAIAATLVQVTNTAADPAITQSANTQASQLVELTLPLNVFLNEAAGLVAMHQFLEPAGVAAESYVVPTGHSLVITGIDMNVSPGGINFSLFLPWSGGNWGISNALLPAGFQQIRYSSGIVVPAGAFVNIGAPNGGSAGDVLIHGYLTLN
jgi:hypothetical protein